MADEQKMAEIADQVGIERVEVLHGYTSMETAYLQEDYPYGRLRTQRRVWLERAASGAKKDEFRLATQTRNPKITDREYWNKPHYSTYAFWAVLVRLPERRDDGDYLSWEGTGIWGPDAAGEIRAHVSGAYAQLDERERKMYDVLAALNRKRNATDRARWEKEIVPTVAVWYASKGKFPSAQDMLDLGLYVPAEDVPPACAAVLLNLGK
jgi:hypothetical protein